MAKFLTDVVNKKKWYIQQSLVLVGQLLMGMDPTVLMFAVTRLDTKGFYKHIFKKK